MKRIKILIFLVLIFPAAFAEDPGYYQRKLYDAYIRDQMQEWEQIIADMEHEYNETKKQDLLHELCFAYYGYIGYLLSLEEDKAAKDALNAATKKTELLMELQGDLPDVLALYGAMLGYRIVLSKFTSMFLGPKALKYIKTAYDSGENCFNCQTEMGNMKFYTPKFLGGSKTEAVPYYEEAVTILESSRLKTDRDWIYMNSVLLLANAYKETGQMDRACELYEAMLEYEPRAAWIRKDLYSKCKQP